LRRGISFDRLTVSLLFIALFARACHSPAQNDTWWHLRAGEDIWHGWFPTSDQWSFTAHGRFWPDHEWLSQAIFYALHTIGGMVAVTLYVALAVVCTYALLWRLMGGSVRRRAILLVATLPATFITSAVRPQVASLLLLLVVATLLVERRFRLLPLVFLLWANLHGAFVLGALVLVVAVVVAFVWERPLARPLVVATALSGIATVLTPLGPRVITLVLGMTNEVDIVEWRPAWDTMPAGAILAVVAIALAIAWRARPPVEWADKVLAGGSVALLPLAVRYSRVIPMFIVIALPLIARAWESRRPHTATADDSSILHSAAVAVTALAAAVWVVLSWAAPDRALAWNPLPSAATQAVRACGQPLYNRFDDGGYLIWFAPDVPVFIDSRVDPFPKDFLHAQIRNESTGDYEATFAEWHIGCALLPPKSSTAQRLQQDGWPVTYRDADWLVLQHPS
jgi:hypothetical protein